MTNNLFSGLSAFPLTPANQHGVVDTDQLGVLVDRLAGSGVNSIGLLGSTGIYAYLDRGERTRAVKAAVEAADGRVPLIVGVGALRTSWAKELAKEAEGAGASGLLLAPMSYTPLNDAEVAQHYKAVAGSTCLPLCIYNNPGTTNFTFSASLIAILAGLPNVAAVKMPLPADGDFAGELARLADTTPNSFSIGYSGDWGALPSLLSGGRAWYSVVAGLLPEISLRLTRAAQEGRVEEATAIDDALQPLWALFKLHGSLRVMYAIADVLALPVGDPPAPLLRLGDGLTSDVSAAIEKLPRR